MCHVEQRYHVITWALQCPLLTRSFRSDKKSRLKHFQTSSVIAWHVASNGAFMEERRYWIVVRWRVTSNGEFLSILSFRVPREFAPINRKLIPISTYLCRSFIEFALLLLFALHFPHPSSYYCLRVAALLLRRFFRLVYLGTCGSSSSSAEGTCQVYSSFFSDALDFPFSLFMLLACDWGLFWCLKVLVGHKMAIPRFVKDGV